jgi:putative addiction module component (TIGR02574 family)
MVVNMKSVPVTELLELPIAERIRLVELVWDSIAAVSEAVSVPDELKAELARRLPSSRLTPRPGPAGKRVRSRILQDAWRNG